MLRDRLRLRDSKTAPRDVPLEMPVRRFLYAQRASLARAARTASAPVFPLADGQCYEPMRSVWVRVRAAAGLPVSLRIHDLRDLFASHAVMSGETLFCTSRLLDYSKVQMAARYARLDDTALLVAAERVGSLIKTPR